jgi:hypothetical protein
MRVGLAAALSTLCVVFAASGARADNWLAAKLAGEVLVFRDHAWVKLDRGDIVSDDSVVRTRQNGNVEFTRDNEVIDVAPDTQIQIFDRTGRRFTTVRQFFGTVSVEANVEKVKHFSVQTPFIAALVKGTIFTVTSDSQSATVHVQRGVVGVEDIARQLHVDVRPGQQATAGLAKGLSVSGPGQVGQVTNIKGQPASPADVETAAAPSNEAPADAAPAKSGASDGATPGVGEASPNVNGADKSDDGDGNGQGHKKGDRHGHREGEGRHGDNDHHAGRGDDHRYGSGH